MAPMKKSIVNILFVISIFINFLLGGVLVGKYFYKCSGKYNGYYNVKLIEQSSIQDENKKLIQDTFAAIQEYKKSKIDEMQNYRNQIGDILTADNFDSNAYENTKSKLQKLRNLIFDDMTAKISGLAQKLTAQERSVLYDAMGQGKGKYKKGSKKDGGDKGNTVMKSDRDNIANDVPVVK